MKNLIEQYENQLQAVSDRIEQLKQEYKETECNISQGQLQKRRILLETEYDELVKAIHEMKTR